MEKLTRRINGKVSYAPLKKGECIDIVDLCDVWGERLADYEDAEEQGLLVRLPISLVPPQIIRDIAEVWAYGVKKYYDPDNWRRVELQRYIDAFLRHTLAFMDDINGCDEESGIQHYKHMACNLAFICELMKEGKA